MPIIIKHPEELVKAVKDHPKKTVVMENDDGTKTVWRAGGGKPVVIPKVPVPRYIRLNDKKDGDHPKPDDGEGVDAKRVKATAKVDRK